MVFVDAYPLRGMSHRKSNQSPIRTDHLYPVMNHFCPAVSGVFQNDPAPIRKARGVTLIARLTEGISFWKNGTQPATFIIIIKVIAIILATYLLIYLSLCQ